MPKLGFHQTPTNHCIGTVLAGLVAIFLTSCGNESTTAPVTSFSTGPVDFETQIRPIFEKRCTTCHGMDQQEGGLRLDSPEAAIAGGHSGPVIVANSADESLLYQAVTKDPADGQPMPPEGEPLSDEQKDLLKRWINQGAKWGDEPNSE